jgi:hypothetical protein
MALLASSARSSASQMATCVRIACPRVTIADRRIDPVPEGNQLPEDVPEGA